MEDATLDELKQILELEDVNEATKEQVRIEIGRMERQIANNRPGTAFAMGMADTASLGFSDELYGGVGAAQGRSYTGDRNTSRALHSSLQQSNPLAYGGGQLVGAVPWGLAGARYLTSRGFGPGAAAGMEGLVGGGVYGIGNSNAPVAGAGFMQDVTTGAGYGLLGGIAGQRALQYLGDVGGAVYNFGRNAFPGQDVAADRVIRRTLEESGMDSVEAVRGEAARLGPEARLVDTSDTALMEGSTASGPSGPGREFAMGELRGRNSTAAQRVEEALVTALDSGFGGTMNQFKGDLRESLKKIVGPMYEEAYEIPIRVTDRMRELSGNPLFREALEEADVNRQWNIGLRETGTGVDASGDALISTEMMHDTLKALNEMIRVAKPNEITGGGNSDRYAALVALKQALRKEVGDQNEPFRQAQEIFADERTLERAMDAGYESMRLSSGRSADVLDDLRGMTGGEQQAFRVGVLDSLLGRLEAMPNNVGREAGDASRRVVNSQRDEEIVRGVLDPGKGDDLLNTLDAEGRFRQSWNEFSKSPTAPRLLTQQRSITVPNDGTSAIARVVNMVVDKLGSREMDAAGREKVVRAMYSKISEMSDKDIQDMLSGGLLSPKLSKLWMEATATAGAGTGAYNPNVRDYLSGER